MIVVIAFDMYGEIISQDEIQRRIKGDEKNIPDCLTLIESTIDRDAIFKILKEITKKLYENNETENRVKDMFEQHHIGHHGLSTFEKVRKYFSL